MESLQFDQTLLTCPVCREIFKVPVFLSCSHSVCEKCLHEVWRETKNQDCPVCKRRSSKFEPPVNLALQNLCESFLKEEKGEERIKKCSFKDEHHLIKKCILIEEGNPARHRLKTNINNPNKFESYRKITFGERDKNKPNKTILLVGETGTGKTALINLMVNYKLGVEREDKVWFEITDDQSDQSSAHSQTSIITVYEFYLQESETDLTIIDTPGFGDTRGNNLDNEIGRGLHKLNIIDEVNIDGVCLVIKATQNRLSDRQVYVFDAVQSLFGRDIADNIVLLFTHSDGFPPKNALTAVKEAQIKCAVNEQKKQPVFFLFNNRQSEVHDEEYEMIEEFAWNLSFRGMTGLFEFLNTVKPKSLKMTQYVLQQQQQLEAKISNLRSRVELTELKQNELKQTQEALELNKELVKMNNNFEFEVEVPYKEWVDIDPNIASMATCCTVCEENCHYPGCWWVSNLSWCSVMKDYHCTVCTNKCHYSKHVKAAKIYVTKTRKEKRTYDDLKKKYDEKIKTKELLVRNLQKELQELENGKAELVREAFHCVETLQMIALNTHSLTMLLHIDFLIEKLKDMNEPVKVKEMEDIKKRAGEGKHRALKYIQNLFKKINK